MSEGASPALPPEPRRVGQQHVADLLGALPRYRDPYARSLRGETVAHEHARLVAAKRDATQPGTIRGAKAARFLGC